MQPHVHWVVSATRTLVTVTGGRWHKGQITVYTASRHGGQATPTSPGTTVQNQPLLHPQHSHPLCTHRTWCSVSQDMTGYLGTLVLGVQWTKLLWKFLYKAFLGKPKFSILLDNYLEVELLGHEALMSHILVAILTFGLTKLKLEWVDSLALWPFLALTEKQTLKYIIYYYLIQIQI